MRRSITIVTYNIRHCLGMNGKVDLDRIVQTLRDEIGIGKASDTPASEGVLICFQELDQFNPRSGFVSQGNEIARRVDTVCVYAATVSFFGLFGFGNAILTNVPVHSTWNRFLPWNGGEPRKVQCVRIGTGDCVVDVYNTHWGLKRNWRVKSATTCAQLINHTSKGVPVIFCGDLNAEVGSAEMQLLIQNSGLRSVGQEATDKTYPSDNPFKRIDHILIGRQFDVEEVRAVRSMASDHLPLIARLSFEG